MSAREFHDAVLLGGRMPVEMVRARLRGQPLSRATTGRSGASTGMCGNRVGFG
jgi:hypothetical protein